MKKFTLIFKVANLMLLFSVFGNYSANARESAFSIVLPPNPAPTLDAVTIAPVCDGSMATVVLSGLIPNTAGTAFFRVGGGPIQQKSGTSTGAGVFSFTTPILTSIANGLVVEITKIRITSTMAETSFTGKTATIVVLPNPTLASVTAAAVCDGSFTTINLSGLLANTAGVATYTVNGGTPQMKSGTTSGTGTFSFTTPILTMADNGSVVEIVKIANNNGCETNFTGKTTTLIVNPLPVVTASSNSPICDGGNLTLSSNGGVSYAWSGPQSFASMDQNPGFVANVAASGNYMVTVTAANGCVNTANTNVVVNPLPVVTASSNSPICDGGNLTLSSNGGVSYSWSGPQSFASMDQNPGFVANVAASGNYMVTVTDANGCVNTANTNVVVNPLPTVEITGTSLICAGNSFSLTASGGTSYAWRGPVGSNNGFSAARFTSSNASISRSINGVGQYHRIGEYTVTVTDANGCINTATQNVGVSPVLTLNTLPVLPPACEGSDFTINSVATITNITKSNSFPYFAASAGNANDITYDWSGPNGFSSTSSNATVNNASMASAGEYTLTITGPGGCTKTATRNATVNPNPVISLDATAEVCEGSDITLTASSNGSVLSWFRNGNPVGLGASLTISSADLSDAGTYTFRSRSTPSLCVSEQSIELVVNARPTISSVSVAPVCSGNATNIVLSGLLANTAGVATYTINGGTPQMQSGTTTAGGTFSFSTPVLTMADNGSVVEITKITNDGTLCETSFTGVTATLVVNPNPTLSMVTVAPVCAGNAATVVLSGLLPNTPGVATYTINGGAPQMQSGTTSATGTFSFATQVLTTAENGYVIEITKITNDGTLCETTFSGKTASLTVNPTPTMSTVSIAPVCAGTKATVVLSGLLPNKAGFATYRVGNGPLQVQNGTTTAGGIFSFTTPVLTSVANGLVVEVTKITINGTLCETSFTGKTAVLVVYPKPTLTTVTTMPVIAGGAATIFLSGLLPSTSGTAFFKLVGSPLPVQSFSGTSSAMGTFSFNTPILGLSDNGRQIEITKISTDVGCETNFTNKTVTLSVISASPRSSETAFPDKSELAAESPSSTFEIENLSKAELILYPNPVVDVLNIETTLDIKSVEFLNVNGQKVLSSNQKQINVSLLPSGTYIVRIEDKGNNVTVKRIIIK